MENGQEMTEVLARLSDVLLKLWPPERILMGMVRHFCSDSDLDLNTPSRALNVVVWQRCTCIRTSQSASHDFIRGTQL